MRIVICGMGYVGATTAACLLTDGHTIVGIDPAEHKVGLLHRGCSPVSERGVDTALRAGLAAGRLHADTCLGDWLDGAEMVLVCVGTPGLANGSLDMRQVAQVANNLGKAIARRPRDAPPLLCVFRSTMLPGTMDELVLPALVAASGEPPGRTYDVAYNPEFLREGTAIEDYAEPPRIVIGERAPGCTKRMHGLYDRIHARLFEVSFRSAEIIKLCDNAFHALKVAFGNEIGRMASALAIDPQTLADMFLADTKLNISPVYLRPGGAFGGSCLPKDVRALCSLALQIGVDANLLAAINPSNMAHKSFLAAEILGAARPGAHILLLGLTFKADTDDLRESPLVDLAETLIGKGYSLSIFEPDLINRELIGANLQFVRERLPHLSRLLVRRPEDAGLVDLLVIGKKSALATDGLWPGIRSVNLWQLQPTAWRRPIPPGSYPDRHDHVMTVSPWMAGHGVPDVAVAHSAASRD